MSIDEKWQAVAEANLAEAASDYSALADPMKYIEVAPAEITHHCPYHMRVKRRGGHKLDDWGRVRDGKWDMERRKVLQTRILTGQLAEHFVDGKPWEACAIWAHKVERIRQKGRIDGCRNKRELRARYERLDALYEQIRSDGRLKSARERGVSLADDLFVSIDREGGYLFGHGGSHRLAIAQLLALPSIPVRVLMRHREWQAVREVSARGETVARADHPDLADCSG